MASTEVRKLDTKKSSHKAKENGVLRPDCITVFEPSQSKLVHTKIAEPKLDKELLLRMYRAMVFTRLFDERGMMLQRQGRIGFFVPSFGQEAIQIGTVAALEKDDWLFPSYREPGLLLYRGASLYHMFCNLWGNKDDAAKGRQMPVHYSFPEHRLFTISSPIATQVIQAVGAAVASVIQGKNEVAATYFGDGGTSENDFHSGLTFAGTFKASVVFICTNNQYAISVPFRKQTGAKRIADKAIGYGMPGIAVDGNDVLAVYGVMKEATDRARHGDGPTLIECVTFRMGPHSSSDDPTRYRDEKLFEAWKKRDPIDRFNQYLVAKKLWDGKKDEKLRNELKEEINAAIAKAEKTPLPELSDLFSDVYSTITPQLERQKADLLREGELRGKFENTSEAFPL